MRDTNPVGALPTTFVPAGSGRITKFGLSLPKTSSLADVRSKLAQLLDADLPPTLLFKQTYRHAFYDEKELPDTTLLMRLTADDLIAYALVDEDGAGEESKLDTSEGAVVLVQPDAANPQSKFKAKVVPWL